MLLDGNPLSDWRNIMNAVHSTMTYCPLELHNRTKTNPHDPFNCIEIDVLFEKGDQNWRVPAFWRGCNNWTVRFSPPETGIYTFKWLATPEMEFACETQGKLEVTLYTDHNPLLKHGVLRVSKNGHYFEFQDGTPFFWLADTWWKGLYKRITLDDFKELTADRVAKNFSVVQIVMGTACDEFPFDPKTMNEGGCAWMPEYSAINPLFYDYADLRIQHLVESGIVPCLICSWGFFVKFTGEEKMRRFVRNIVARYAAYPVIFAACGEVSLPYYLNFADSYDEDQAMQREVWTRLCRYIKQIDGHGRIVTTHPSQSTRREVQDDKVVDFDMLQTGHFGWHAAENTIALVSSGYHKLPHKPVLVSEVAYEGHMDSNWADVQRYMFWTSILNGSCGHTYGAGGIWQMNAERIPNGVTPHGGTYENTPWRVAAQFPGAKQLGLAKTILEDYRWWEFEPHPEWIDPCGIAFTEDFEEWFDALTIYRERVGKANTRQQVNKLVGVGRPPRKPTYAAGIPRQVRFVYVPNREYDWSSPTIVNLEPDVLYSATFINPATGEKTDLGFLPEAATEWCPSPKPTCRDYLLVLEVVDQEILNTQRKLAKLMQ
jgi:hypothetical protein